VITAFTSAGSNPLLAMMDVDAVLATLIPMAVPGPLTATGHLERR
jgi:hypothetical protein